jgi:hypothetical protein
MSSIKRREFITLLGGAAAWPLAARAQQPGKVFRVGYVSPLASNSLPKRLDAFRVGLRDLGYEEGRNIVIEYRWADEHYERLPTLFAVGSAKRRRDRYPWDAGSFCCQASHQHDSYRHGGSWRC